MSDYKWPDRKRPGVQPWVMWLLIILALAAASALSVI